MKLIKKLMERRQFLAAAGIVSTSAVAYTGLAGVMDPAFQTSNAMASEKSGTAVKKGAYLASGKYSHLLSPLKIGNLVLKNRIYSTNAVPHYIQGPENFPAETSRFYAANLAKNGAAIVTCRIIQNRVRKDLHGDSAHMLIYDLDDYGVQNYLDQLVEGIHCYGAKASVPIRVASSSGGGMPGMPGGAPPSGIPGGAMPAGAGGPGGAMPSGGMPAGEPIVGGMAAQKEMTPEEKQKQIEEVVAQTKFFQNHGFDLVCLGGSGKRSADLFRAVKKACGQDFVIENVISLIDPTVVDQEETSTAYTLDEAIAFVKQMEGLVDILQLRMAGGMTNHPTGWNSQKNKPLTLKFAEALKKTGTKIAIAPNGGFHDPDFNNDCIASGKADLMAMGHAFITDWEYGRKIHEGRGEDITPCIMCNKCHGLSQTGQWYTVCSVNPKVGIDSALRIIDAPAVSKKVAVIGGGPAGMKAALTAAERGHKVTLFEKSTALGGLTKHADYSPFKWPLKSLKDFLVDQINKAGVEIVLNKEATPEMIKAKGYDMVMVAVGASPNIPRISGVEGKNVYNIMDAYAKEKELGKDVVFIGSGEFGVETGIFLANAGHNVAMLTSERELMKINRVHYPEQIIDKYKHLKNFSSITEVMATGISDGKVAYKDSKGNEKSIHADSIVVYAGLKARKDEALKFYGSAPRYIMIGDCGDEGGDVQKSIRSAFFAASQV